MRIFLLFLLASASAFCIAQESLPAAYEFKTNRLGESLDEFRAIPDNASDVYVNTGNPNAWRVDKKKTVHIQETFCSDRYQVPGKIYRPDVVECTIPRAKNNDENFITTTLISDLTYSFYKGRLYQISMHYFSSNYAGIARAFRQKYGDPSQTKTEAFQNAYGATWSGDVLYWLSGTQGIVVSEGSGNGPAQNGMDMHTGASILFSDSALAPPDTKQVLNF